MGNVGVPPEADEEVGLIGKIKTWWNGTKEKAKAKIEEGKKKAEDAAKKLKEMCYQSHYDGPIKKISDAINTKVQIGDLSCNNLVKSIGGKDECEGNTLKTAFQKLVNDEKKWMMISGVLGPYQMALSVKLDKACGISCETPNCMKKEEEETPQEPVAVVESTDGSFAIRNDWIYLGLAMIISGLVGMHLGKQSKMQSAQVFDEQIELVDYESFNKE